MFEVKTLPPKYNDVALRRLPERQGGDRSPREWRLVPTLAARPIGDRCVLRVTYEAEVSKVVGPRSLSPEQSGNAGCVFVLGQVVDMVPYRQLERHVTRPLGSELEKPCH